MAERTATWFPWHGRSCRFVGLSGSALKQLSSRSGCRPSSTLGGLRGARHAQSVDVQTVEPSSRISLMESLR
eukprot:4084147-Prymnesium_polylepis.1